MGYCFLPVEVQGINFREDSHNELHDNWRITQHGVEFSKPITQYFLFISYKAYMNLFVRLL